jgi:hypothetical protein
LHRPISREAAPLLDFCESESFSSTCLRGMRRRVREMPMAARRSRPKPAELDEN